MAGVSLTTAYVTALLSSGAIALGVGLWASATTDIPERWLFLGLMGVDAAWTAVAAAGLVVRDPTATHVFLYLTALAAVSAAGVWYVFATTYTGRPLRDWRHVAVLGPLVAGAVIILTNPLHRLHWTAVTYQAEPLSFTATTTGPLSIPVTAWVFVTISIGLYYLGELFLKSRHRASSSLFVLLAGGVVASLPNVASNLGMVPVPAYDHTVFGVVGFAVAAGYAVFGLGMFDIRPIARDDLVDEVDDALFVLDAEGLLVDYNAASESLLTPCDADTPIGQPLSTVCPTVASGLTLPDTSGSQTTEIVTFQRDGRQAHYSGQVTTVTENDDIVGYSVILRDITAQIEYREELEHRNEQLDQFASAVAHDLRNPLQVAFGRTRLLDAALPAAVETDSDVARSLDTLGDSLERMDDIITDLRTLAEQGQAVEAVEPIDFEATVQAATETVTTGTATVEIDAGGTIEAERSRLLSILENLLRNSLDHAGPDVSVRATLTADGFVVEDDGPGIPEPDRAAVFEYGYTASEDGTGLGLAIVRTMVSAHGWDIEVSESESGGARFVVTGASTSLAA